MTMIQTGFWIGERDWWVMATIDIRGERDLGEVFKALMSCGCPNDEAQKACMVLSKRNSGYTFTDAEGRYTLMFVSEADSVDELFDTIIHEVRHATDHIGEYFGLKARGEDSAYLQGEISKKLFPAVALAVCPKCHEEKEEG